ncbi:MAG: hypothetical protein ACKO85_10715 [Isosphaeraceae bacterium]
MRRTRLRDFGIMGLIFLGFTTPVSAGVGEKVLQETAEFVLRKFGKTALREGAETFAERLGKASLRHGDDILTAVRKVGPKAMKYADDAGEEAPKVIRLLSKHGDDAAHWVIERPQAMKLLSQHGDDAAEVMIRHKGLAEPVLERLGKPAVDALGAVGPQGGRRMAMLAESGDLAKLGQVPELMNVIARYGDPAMDFIWRNKGPLAVGTTLTAFLAEPKAFIEGSASLAATVGSSLVQPVVQESAKAFSWVINMILAFLMVGAGAGGYLAFRYPRIMAEMAKAAIFKMLKRS